MFNGDKSLSNLKNRATPASIIQKPFDSPEEDVVVLFKTLYSNWSDGATTITKDQLSCNPGVTQPQWSSQHGYFAATVYLQHRTYVPPPNTWQRGRGKILGIICKY